MGTYLEGLSIMGPVLSVGGGGGGGEVGVEDVGEAGALRHYVTDSGDDHVQEQQQPSLHTGRLEAAGSTTDLVFTIISLHWVQWFVCCDRCSVCSRGYFIKVDL